MEPPVKEERPINEMIKEEEDEGLDLSEHGQPAYADFQHINN